jgi:hypothetical protein
MSKIVLDPNDCMTLELAGSEKERQPMSITVLRFEWDEFNLRSLEAAHPHVDLEMLEAIVQEAKAWRAEGRDRFGKKVYSAAGHGWRVYFNVKPGRIARIFSVREE